MKRFLKKILFFVIPTLIIYIVVISQADGYTDPYYIRFTSPKKGSLILGTSRSAQGIQPQVLNEQLGREFFNYSFTLTHSPYGPIYLESIKRKHDNSRSDNIFILSVDPWSVSSNCSDPNNNKQFREVNQILDEVEEVNMDPNYYYLFKNIRGNLFTVFVRDSNLFLHENGWLEVSVEMDSASISKRTNKKMRIYREENLPNFKFSALRFKYLQKTIDYLKSYGDVYLVRLPVCLEMDSIENEFMSDFNYRISELSDYNGYLDLTDQNDLFVYTDGNHLHKKSGYKVTTMIAKWIKEQE